MAGSGGCLPRARLGRVGANCRAPICTHKSSLSLHLSRFSGFCDPASSSPGWSPHFRKSEPESQFAFAMDKGSQTSEKANRALKGRGCAVWGAGA